MTMIGCATAEVAEADARRSMRVQIARPIRSVFPGLLAKLRNIFGKALKFGIDNWIWPEGRQNPRSPIRFSDGLVIGQQIQWRIRRRQHLQIKTLVKSERQEFRCQELCRDRIEVKVGGLFRQSLLKPEKFLESKIQPHARRRSAEQIIMTGKDPPDFSGVL